MDRIRIWLESFRTWFGGLDATRRNWFVVSAALGTAIVVGAVNLATYVQMAPLYETPLDNVTTSGVVEHLKTAGVRYEHEDGTGRVLVPTAQRSALRVELGGKGLMDSKGVGMELFEDNRFGSTRFVEHIRYVRGLQGEIERQINGFDSVAGSKVLLSMPEQSLFEEDKVDPSASVYLQLKSGRSLTSDEGARMANLVANAVPRLRDTRVAIMDAEMRVIHAATDDTGESSVAGHLASLKRDYERYYKREIERVLERVVGPGKVVARVNVELDNSQRSRHERKLHGEEAVAIATQSRESSRQGGAGATGVPGTTSNIAEIQAANPRATGESVTESSETQETGNFDVPETRTQEASLPGGIRSITAAVLVDGVWTEVTPDGATGVTAEKGEGAAKDGGAAKPTYAARTEAELAAFKTLVAMSLGITETAVTVVNQPFAQVDVPMATASFLNIRPGTTWEPALRYGFALLALLFTFGFIVRPMMRGVASMERTDIAGALPEPHAGGQLGDGRPLEPQGESLQELIARVARGEELVSRDEVNRLVSADVTHSVVTLQAWINQD